MDEETWERHWGDIVAAAAPTHGEFVGPERWLGREHIFGLANVLARPILLVDAAVSMDGEFSGMFLPLRHTRAEVLARSNGRFPSPLCIGWAGAAHNHYVSLVRLEVSEDERIKSLTTRQSGEEDEAVVQRVAFWTGVSEKLTSKVLDSATSGVSSAVPALKTYDVTLPPLNEITGHAYQRGDTFVFENPVTGKMQSATIPPNYVPGKRLTVQVEAEPFGSFDDGLGSLGSGGVGVAGLSGSSKAFVFFVTALTKLATGNNRSSVLEAKKNLTIFIKHLVRDLENGASPRPIPLDNAKVCSTMAVAGAKDCLSALGFIVQDGVTITTKSKKAAAAAIGGAANGLGAAPPQTVTPSTRVAKALVYQPKRLGVGEYDELVKLVREAHELCSTMPVGQITGQAEVVASGAAHLFGPNPVFFESWRRQQRSAATAAGVAVEQAEAAAEGDAWERACFEYGDGGAVSNGSFSFASVDRTSSKETIKRIASMTHQINMDFQTVTQNQFGTAQSAFRIDDFNETMGRSAYVECPTCNATMIWPGPVEGILAKFQEPNLCSGCWMSGRTTYLSVNQTNARKMYHTLVSAVKGTFDGLWRCNAAGCHALNVGIEPACVSCYHPRELPQVEEKGGMDEEEEMEEVNADDDLAAALLLSMDGSTMGEEEDVISDVMPFAAAGAAGDLAANSLEATASSASGNAGGVPPANTGPDVAIMDMPGALTPAASGDSTASMSDAPPVPPLSSLQLSRDTSTYAWCLHPDCMCSTEPMADEEALALHMLTVHGIVEPNTGSGASTSFPASTPATDLIPMSVPPLRRFTSLPLVTAEEVTERKLVRLPLEVTATSTAVSINGLAATLPAPPTLVASSSEPLAAAVPLQRLSSAPVTSVEVASAERSDTWMELLRVDEANGGRWGIMFGDLDRLGVSAVVRTTSS
mmetsp:Transcript_39280/g.90478  ORF Transcript_39280/g.90478 Transcript_39280/m.90478 type:complete len:926 (+) Transcript_39280:684-3461(+)